MKKQLLIVTAAAGLCAAAIPTQASAHDEPVIGVLGGAAVGAAIGGPPGAVAGAIIGAMGGATVAHNSDHGHRHGHHHYYPKTSQVTYVEPAPVAYYADEPRVRYVEKVRYVQPVASCEPQVVYYRPASATHGAAPVKKAATTKVKKVCRYEKVKVHTASAARRPIG